MAGFTLWLPLPENYTRLNKHEVPELFEDQEYMNWWKTRCFSFPCPQVLLQLLISLGCTNIKCCMCHSKIIFPYLAVRSSISPLQEKTKSRLLLSGSIMVGGQGNRDVAFQCQDLTLEIKLNGWSLKAYVEEFWPSVCWRFCITGEHVELKLPALAISDELLEIFPSPYRHCT